MVSPIDFVYGSVKWLELEGELARSESLSVNACLKRAGFRVTGPVPTEPKVEEGGEPNVARRRATGWRTPANADGSQPTVSPGQVLPSGVDVSEVAYGTPDQTVPVDQGGGSVGEALVGGCRGEFITRVFGSIQAWDRLTNTTWKYYNDWIFGSTAVAPDRIKKWSRCMDDAGYEFASPGEPERFARSHGKDGTLTSEEESKLAVVDAGCLKDSGILAERLSGAERYLASLPQKEVDDLEEAARSLPAVMQKARESDQEALDLLGLG